MLDMVNNENILECIICLENIDKNFNIKKDCKCVVNLHKKCFVEWNIKNKNQCPLCRKVLNKEDIIVTINPVNMNEENINPQNNNRFQGESISKRKKFIYCILLLATIFGIFIGLKSVY